LDNLLSGCAAATVSPTLSTWTESRPTHFLTADPTGCRYERLPIGTLMHRADRTLEQSNLPRNLAGTRQPIRPQPSRQLPAPRSRLSRKPRKPLSTVPF